MNMNSKFYHVNIHDKINKYLQILTNIDKYL